MLQSLSMVTQLAWLIALLQAGFAVAPNTPDGQLRFKIPDGWTQITSENLAHLSRGQSPEMVAWMKTSSYRLLASDLRGIVPGYQVSLNARVRRGPFRANDDIIAYLKQQTQGTAVPGHADWTARFLEGRVVLVGSVRCVRLLMETDRPDGPTRQVMYFIPAGNAYHGVVAYTASRERFAAYEASFDAAAKATIGARKASLLAYWWAMRPGLVIAVLVVAAIWPLTLLSVFAVLLVRRRRRRQSTAPAPSAPPPAATAVVPASLGPGKALLILLAFLAAQLFGGLAVGVVGGVWFALKRGAAALGSVAEIQRALIMPCVLAGAVCGGVFSFLLTWLMLRTTEPPRLRSIGWSRASRRDLLIASLAGLGLAAAYVFGVVPHFPAAPGHHWGPIVQAASSGGWSRHLWAVLGILIAPPSEEFVFRGVLFTGFLRRWSAITAGVLVTLLFLLGHLTEVWGYAPALVAVIVLGVATLFARILTKSLAPAVALHATYNLLLVVTSYAA